MVSSTIPLHSGKSKVWRYFGFKTDEKGTILTKKEVLCQKCEQKLPYSGIMTNLTYNLKHCHEEEYALLCKAQIPSSSSKPKKKEQIQMDYFTKGFYTRGSQRYKTCENAVMDYICKDMEPLSTIDSIPFLQLVKTLDPRYKPSSRSHFTQVLLPAKYESTRASITDSLSNTGCCSLMTDMWTGCHSRSYMAVTAHITFVCTHSPLIITSAGTQCLLLCLY